MKVIEWDGKPISKPGIYSRMSLAAYHSRGICVGPSVSSGGLRRIEKLSPAHFFCTWPENPKCIERKDTRALILGRAAHHLLLGELYFGKLFAQQPLEYVADNGEVKPWTYRANVCKQWKADQERAGRAVVTLEDFEAIRGMSDSLKLFPIVAKEKALGGMVERSMFWQDKATGLWCKARPDAIPTHSGDYVDLKTTTSVLWRDMQKTIYDFGYHQQGAWIRAGSRALFGLDTFTFSLVFVEKEPPYCVRFVEIKYNDLDRGEKQNRKALDTIGRCLKSGAWPGPGGDREDAMPIEMPEWAQKSIDERLNVEWS